MTATLPLDGIRVIEMSHMVMGPACGMILVQLGAEVIKVEPPTGDKTRDLRGMGTSFFPLFNRGKKSVTLDLKDEDDLKTLHKLIGTADVFLENFRDQTLEKQGLDASSLQKSNPNLIIAGHKGFLSGPYEARPALDEVVQMMSGLAMMTGSKEKPLRVGSSANDIMGGMFGVISIIAALWEREKTGKGKNIRIGLFENALFMVAQHMVQFDLTGVPSTPMPQRTHAWPVYDIFDTTDGEKVFIGVVTEGHWNIFCKSFDLPELLENQDLKTATDRIEARSWTIPLIREKLAPFTAAELLEKLEALALPFARINAPEDLFEDPHVLRPGGLVTSNHPDGSTFRSPVLPIELDGQHLGEALDVPILGADNDEILGKLEKVGKSA